MKLGGPTIVSYRKPHPGRRQARPGPVLWKARWRVYPDDVGKPIETSRSGFATKALADDFAKNLRRAEVEADGWSFDDRGHPVRTGAASAAEALDRDGVGVGPTVVEAARRYAVSCFPELRGATCSKNTSVMARFVALTLADPGDRAALLAALALEHEHLRSSDPAHAAAMSLREAVFVADPSADAPGGPHAEGLAWLAARSRPLADLASADKKLLGEIYRHFTKDFDYSTARSYWSVVKAVCNWWCDQDLFVSDPLRGFATVKRDKAAEIVDPSRVLDPDELDEIVAVFDARGWTDEGTFVLTTGHAALRGGEAYGLEVADFHHDGTRYWIAVSGQVTTTAKRHPKRPGPRQPTKEAKSVADSVRARRGLAQRRHRHPRQRSPCRGVVPSKCRWPRGHHQPGRLHCRRHVPPASASSTERGPGHLRRSPAPGERVRLRVGRRRRPNPDRHGRRPIHRPAGSDQGRSSRR